MKQILLISYGDSCRSRIARELLSSFGRGMDITTAGITDGYTLSESLVTVMSQNGYEISRKKPVQVGQLPQQQWDYVITLCKEAQDEYPNLQLHSKGVAHLDFPDPFAQAFSSDEEREQKLTEVYELMYRQLFRFYRDVLSDLLMPTCTCGANTYCRCE